MTVRTRGTFSSVVAVLVFAGSVPASARLPWADAGLTEREAAAHLLDRFTFGPAPGQIDAVVTSGLESWLERQLAADERSRELESTLSRLRSVDLSNREILALYPSPGRIRNEAIEQGLLDAELPPDEQRRILRDYLEDQGLREQRELFGEIVAAKILRATLSSNQLEEVMVDFWFEHFTVSGTDNECRRFVGTYERDAIRPHALGSFGDLLEATAKHPAMLLYLDNAQSRAPVDAITTADLRREELRDQPGREGLRWDRIDRRMDDRENDRRERMMERGAQRGLNENYARELLELHTLGVDGGYEQSDVVEVARALTGWTVLPDGERAERIRESSHDPVMRAQGYLLEGDFFFDAGMHDAGEKTILGQRFLRGGDLAEGEAVLRHLAEQPATARFVSRKLAVRFVRDDPSDALVDDLAAMFRSSDGDIRELLRAIARHPEFWESRREKIKRPLEVVISSVRGLDARVERPRVLVRWIDRMGQPVYRAPAPTGFPDRAEAWVSAGSLLHRMNFGLAMGGGFVKGVEFDPDAFHDGLEPESGEAALREYAARLIPERDLEETLAALTPMLGRPGLADEIRTRAEEAGGSDPDDFLAADDAESSGAANGLEATAAQVLGLILGSPEYQRR